MLKAAGLGSKVTEQESSRARPGTVLEQNPAEGANLAARAARSTSSWPSRVPTVPDVTTGNPTVEEATQTLEEAGSRSRPPTGRRPIRAGRARDRPVAGRRHPAFDRRHGHHRLVRRHRATPPTPSADARRHEGRGPRRRPLVRARRLAELRRSVREGVAAAGHEVLDVPIERSRRRGRTAASRSRCTPGGGLLGADAVFPVLHGPFGEDGTLQGLLELLDVPYVGAGVLASSLCMDKVVFKEVLAAAGRAAGALRGRARAALAGRAGGRPARAGRARHAVFVKPARLGSSVGIAKVSSEAELAPALDPAFAHDSLVIVEGFSPGMEVECSVLGIAASPTRRSPARSSSRGADWYDYEAKYTDGGMELVVPARLPDAVLEEVRRLAVDTFVRVGCAGLARVDFFVEDGERVLVNELNTLPGFTSDERVPEAVGGSRACRSRSSATGCSRFALERFEASAASRVLARCDPLRAGRISEISRARRPAASFVIQTR